MNKTVCQLIIIFLVIWHVHDRNKLSIVFPTGSNIRIADNCENTQRERIFSFLVLNPPSLCSNKIYSYTQGVSSSNSSLFIYSDPSSGNMCYKEIHVWFNQEIRHTWAFIQEQMLNSMFIFLVCFEFSFTNDVSLTSTFRCQSTPGKYVV